MKKQFVVLTAFLLILTLIASCATTQNTLPTQPLDTVGTPQNLVQFGDLKWDSTPEKAIEALHLPADCETQSSMDELNGNPNGIYSLLAQGYEAFDCKTNLVLRFADYDGSGEQHLYWVEVFFQDDPDPDAVLQKITQVYGTPVDRYRTNALLTGSADRSDVNREVWTEDGTYWVSDVTCYSLLTSQERERVIGITTNPELPVGAFTREETELLMQNPASHATFYNNPYSIYGNLPHGSTVFLILQSELPYWRHMPEPTPKAEPEIVPEEVHVHPFTDEELTQGAETAKQLLGTEASQYAFVAFDPILTDLQVKQQMEVNTHPGWTQEDYYERFLAFTASTGENAESEVLCITLYRLSAEGPWMEAGRGDAPSEVMKTIMDPATLPALDADAVAAYARPGGDYWVYLRNPVNGEICVRLG